MLSGWSEKQREAGGIVFNSGTNHPRPLPLNTVYRADPLALRRRGEPRVTVENTK